MEIVIKRFEESERERLKQQWLALQDNVENCSFFVSWQWVETWIDVLAQEFFIVSAFLDSELIAIGCVSAKSNGLRAYLNKVGDYQRDQVWIEFNDFLINADNPSEIRQQIYTEIFSAGRLTSSLQSIDVDMTPVDLTSSKQYLAFCTLCSLGYTKSLQGVETWQDLMMGFSSNSRKQINRSKNLLSSSGALKLRRFDSVQEKQEALFEIGENHKKQWSDSQWGSGFDNPFFVSFHQKMLESAQTCILMLELNNKPLAYGYYFCFNNKVYFYLSAIQKHSDNKIKLGLVFHCEAMLHFAELGYQVYDFLAGEARYKKSLSDGQYQLSSYRLYKNNLLGKLEYWARRIKSLASNSSQ